MKKNLGINGFFCHSYSPGEKETCKKYELFDTKYVLSGYRFQRVKSAECIKDSQKIK
jgi:hypothetical protein